MSKHAMAPWKQALHDAKKRFEAILVESPDTALVWVKEAGYADQIIKFPEVLSGLFIIAESAREFTNEIVNNGQVCVCELTGGER